MKGSRIHIALIFCLLAFPQTGFSQSSWKDFVEFGVEWGYSATYYEYYHYNYISGADGSRIDSKDSHLNYKSNGHLYAYAGIRPADFLSIDLRSGWAGVFEGRRVMPLTLEVNFLPSGCNADGWKYSLEGGMLLTQSHMTGQYAYIAKALFARRVKLSDYLCLDMGVSLQAVADHPTDVYDKSRSEIVANGNLLRSDCYYSSLNFSIGLCF